MAEPGCRRDVDDLGANDAASSTSSKAVKTYESREGANAVSRLQEFIQSCSSLSPRRKILTWTFDQENEMALKFRATVSFVFNNVPHHFCGGWQPSKKKAQRDTAERVRLYLSCSLREAPPTRVMEEDIYSAPMTGSLSSSSAFAPGRSGGSGGRTSASPDSLPESVAEELLRVFQGAAGEEEQEHVKWEVEASQAPAEAGKGRCRATATFPIMGVPHHFMGGWCPTAASARRDDAERVLWYFGRLAEGGFCATVGSACAGTGPPLQLCAPGGSRGRADGSGSADGDGADAEGKQSLDDKMILMQVHNTLQQSLAKDTQPGEHMWVMSYESDPKDLQLFCAIIKVPRWEKTFYGEWCRGKKAAQRSACLVVRDELAQRPPVQQA